MRIEFHPKPDGMQHVNLMFCEEEPDPEDLWVRAQLERFSIPPKRILQWEREGRRYQVWQYGQCVIGNAMFYIEKHKGVVERIRQLCADELQRAPLAKTRLNELISEVAQEFDKQARFTVDGSGDLTIALDEERLRARMVERLAAG